MEVRSLLVGWTLISVVLCGAFCVCSHKPISSPDYMRGVWISKDREIIITNKFQIDFSIDSTGGIWAKLSLLEYKDSSLTIDTRGVVYVHGKGEILKASLRGKDQILKASLKDVLGKSDSLIFNSSKDTENLVKKSAFDIKQADNNEIILDSPSERIAVGENGSMKIFENGSLSASLFRTETFDVSENYIPTKKLSESTIKDCLRDWMLTTTAIEDDRGNNVGLEINTKEHMYIFAISGLDDIYCRAARYATSDKGVVFDQNIRVRVDKNTWSVFSVKDNTIAAKKRNVDEKLFSPKMCVFADSGIYWSVKSVSDSLIELNGCGGEIYRWERPTKEDSLDIIEWIK